MKIITVNPLLQKIEDEEALSKAYKELLKIGDISLRLQLQQTYCLLRDTLADRQWKSSQEVQETHEEMAVKEKYNLR